MLAPVLTHPLVAVARPATAAQMLARADRGGLSVDDVILSGIYGGGAYLAGTGSGVSILAHEAGHAVAANALFTGANPRISIQPLQGGVTHWNPNGGLTDLGRHFGVNGSEAIVSAAGAAVDTGLAMVSFAAGYKMRHAHPIVGRALMGYAGMSMLNDTLYAATALGGSVAKLAETGNDFAALALHTGLPPIVGVAVMAAALPAEYLVLRALEKRGML